MTTLTQTPAFESGYSDGQDRVEQDARCNDGQPVEVDSWFRAGQLLADEALLNALVSSLERAEALGLTVAAVESQGEEWHLALAQYNAGFEAGAREAAANT